MGKQKTFHAMTSLISVLLCITLTLGIFINSMITLNVFALDSEDITDATTLDNFDYTVNHAKQTVVLTKYKGTATAVKVAPMYTINGVEYATVLDSTTVFKGNTKIKSVKLYPGVSFANNTTDYLFFDCTNLETVDMQGVNTTSVTSMRYMFATTGNKTYTKVHTINMSDIDTSSVTTMYAMFSMCQKLANLIGYEYWDTSSLENMFWMFNKISGLQTIDLSRWDLSNVNNSAWCFQNSGAKQILLPDSLKTMSAGFLNHAASVTGSTFTIPAGVEKIGYAHTIYDFATSEFVEFIVPEENENFVAVDGILYSADMKELLAIPRGKTFENNTFYVPEGVEFMAELSFSRNYNVKTLVLPNTYEIVTFIPAHDPRYIIYEDIGNLNASNSLAIALYDKMGIVNYAVKDDNPRYASKDGIIYSKDMTTLISIPTLYNQYIDIPEGVTTWAEEAVWSLNHGTLDGHMKNCTGVNIPSTLTYISQDQLNKINRLNKAHVTFEVTVHPDNPVYATDENGNLITTGVVARNESTNELYTTLSDAIVNAVSGDTITILDNITLGENITVSKDITLSGMRSIIRDTNYTGKLFTVSADATLTLDGDITIDGNHNWTFKETEFQAAIDSFLDNPTIVYSDCHMFVEAKADAPIASASTFAVSGNMIVNKATLKNHFGNVSGHLITLESTATLTVNDGALFTHNTQNIGNGIIVTMKSGSEFVMNGGEITGTFSGSKSGNNGWGGCINNIGGVFTMNGGKIYKNYACGTNGTVMRLESLSTGEPGFIMNGGEICENLNVCSARAHGGSIMLMGNAYMVMNDGRICHNVGASLGGVEFYKESAKLEVTNGYIVENVAMRAPIHTDVHDLHDFAGTTTITGGTFSQEIVPYIDTTKYGAAIKFVKGTSGAEFVYYTVTTDLVKNERTGEIYHNFTTADADAQDGDTLVILEDTRVYGTPETITKDVNINLDNKTLYGWNDSLTTMFDIQGNVTVIPGGDDGMIDASRKSNASIFTVTNGGTLSIEDGIYRADGNLATVESGELCIENGYFDTTLVDGKYALDCNDANHTNGTAKLVTLGGTYTNFDPENNGAEGDETDFCTPQLATRDNNDGSWTVVPADPVCWNTDTGIVYKKVDLAMKEVVTGQTVQLLKSAPATTVFLDGTKFDLNGFTLTADLLVGNSASSIYDSANNSENGYRANGMLKIDKSSLILSENNGAVPVYVPDENGYIFVDFLFNSQNVQMDEISRINLLATSRTMQVIDLLKNASADNDIQIIIRLTVDGESKDFAFSENTIRNVMQSNKGKFNLFDRMFYANFTGVEQFTSVTARAAVIAHGQVIDFGSELILK